MGNDYIKRKTYVVDKSFQYKLISKFLFSILLALVFFSGCIVLYYLFSATFGDNVFKENIIVEKQVKLFVDSEGNPRYALDGKIGDDWKPVYRPDEEGNLTQEQGTTSVQLDPVKRWEIVLPVILWNNLVIMIVLSVMGIFYSHKMAGPVYRMNADIRMVLGGELGKRIKLRKKDEFQSLADNINLLFDSYQKAKGKK